LPKSPDYASRTSFVSEFQKDFENMIDSYVREDERLYVFIDDLDRCDMSRASELMQAIMLLINDGDRIVFVLGMDRDKVAAGIGLKYKDYVPLLSHLEDGTPSSPRELIRFGYEYLEKFIHLPFLVPVPRMVDISRFLGGLYSDNLKEKTGQTVQASKTVGPEVITSDGGLPKTTTYTLFTKINTSNVILTVKNDSEAVRSMVLMVAPLLSNNPRRLKQFLNLYRLTLFLADKTGLLGEGATLPQLAKFTALRMRYSELISELRRNPDCLKQSEAEVLKAGETSASYPWTRETTARQLLVYRVDESDYSLGQLAIEPLLRTSPAVTKDTQGQVTNEPAFSSVLSGLSAVWIDGSWGKRETVIANLIALGADIYTALDVSSGLAAFRKTPFDLVIVYIDPLNGFKLALLKELVTKGVSVPVIVFSKDLSVELERACISEGAFACADTVEKLPSLMLEAIANIRPTQP
jgi:hypothetical protein